MGTAITDQSNQDAQDTQTAPDVNSALICEANLGVSAAMEEDTKDKPEEKQSSNSEKEAEAEDSIDIFNVDKIVKYSSDEEDVDSSSSEDEANDTNGKSSNGALSPNSSDDDSSDEDADEEDDESEIKDMDLEDEINEGEDDEPIKSKNEILDFKVPSIPDDYVIA